MQIIAYIFCIALVGMSSFSAFAHEFWIEPSEFHPKFGSEVTVDLMVGQEFSGFSGLYVPDEIASFSVFDMSGEHIIEGRYGDKPAGRFKTKQLGLSIINHQTRPQYIDYRSPKKFIDFATSKGFLHIAKLYQDTGDDDFVLRETYRRFAKSLLAVEHANVGDRVLGFELELVALQNPYAQPPPDTIDVVVYERGIPRPGAQVTIFVRCGLQRIHKTVVHADAEGIVTVSLQAGCYYMVDSVVLRRPEMENDVGNIDWESLWASLTFALPDF